MLTNSDKKDSKVDYLWTTFQSSRLVVGGFNGREVTWNACALNVRARPVTDVRHLTHREDDEVVQEG